VLLGDAAWGSDGQGTQYNKVSDGPELRINRLHRIVTKLQTYDLR